MVAHASTTKHRSKLRPAAIVAYLAILGRIVVAPMLLIVFALKTDYMTNGKVFIGADSSYFAYSQQDAVMVGGCTNCNIGCRKTFLQMLSFEGSALMNKPAFEKLYSASTVFNESLLTDEMRALADTIDADPNADCMSGLDEWGSVITTVAGHPQYVVDMVRLLKLSMPPHPLREVQEAVATVGKCPTRWVFEAHVRLFKFQLVAKTADYSSIPAADFTIFPEYTECRGNVSNDEIVGSRLALDTKGVDLVAVVPDILTLFPYSFKSSLKEVSRVIQTTTATKYNAANVTQPLFHGYYGGCRVREVNEEGVFVEDTCTIDPHWENYGLMLQSPDDIPVCSTTDVCVHNYYNSLWEFGAGIDKITANRFWMAVNVFRNRYADTVAISVLPGMVVIQILFMGMISLYQTMSQKRSVLLTQIWAYRCQNGRMQVWYLAQVTYHLAYNSDLYFLGLTTGTLSLESIANLTLCFYAFSYSFINLMKARSGEQQLDRYFRLTWEIMQIFTTSIVAILLYSKQRVSLNFIMTENGEFLRKTTARGAKYCNLSDSCIVFQINLGVFMALAALVLGIIPFSFSSALQRSLTHKKTPSKKTADRYRVHDVDSLPAPGHSGQLSKKRDAGGDKMLDDLTVDKINAEGSKKPDDPTNATDETCAASTLTSFELNCLGVPFTTLFNDCDDFSHVVYRNHRATSVEAVLLTGFLYYGKNVYQGPAVMLLLIARLLPRRVLRTFNVLLIRWHLDPLTGTVSPPSSCTWYTASAEKYKLSSAVPIK